MRALRYITSPNMAVSDGKNYGGSIDNGLLGMLSMSPFSSRCCQHNHGMGWPYFTEHLVMGSNDGGLCATLYSANQTTATVSNGVTVLLKEDTNYPFEEDIKFTVHCSQSVAFPLYLRIPVWAEHASITVDGDTTNVQAGKYVKLNRVWNDGDQVTLHLPMTITTQTWSQNKGSVSVNYGPLTLSLKIAEQYRQRDPSDPDIVQGDSHWQTGVDKSKWPAWEIFADSPWNYALKVDDQLLPVDITVVRKPWPADNYPFTLESVPLEFTAKGQKVPSWGFDDKGMTDVLPTRFATRDKEVETIHLVPMGAARLRISAFPRADIEGIIPGCEE